MSVIGHPGATRAEPSERSAPAGFAAALIGLGALGILGSAAQLAAPGSVYALPWVAAIALATAAALLTVPRVGRPGRRVARVLCLVVLVSASTAAAEHVAAGPGVPVGAVTHSWYSGGTAPLVPGLLGQSALLLLVASLRAGPRLGRLGRRVSGRIRGTSGPA